MKRPHLYPEIFLVSFAALLLEISYTRVFSFKSSSYFTYVIIAYALLGLGAGGMWVSLSDRLRRAAPERLLPALGTFGAVAVAGGYLAVAVAELSTVDPATSPGQLLLLAGLCAVLFASFLAAGLMIAAILADGADALGRLYGADLLGAAVGCAAAIPLMESVSPPGCVMVSAAALALSGVRTTWTARRPMAVASAALALLLLCAAPLGWLPDPVVDPAKTLGRRPMRTFDFRTVFSEWSAVFRVDVVESKLIPNRKGLVHDGELGSFLWRFNGDWSGPRAFYRTSNRQLPFSVLADEPRVLIVGSAGGNEILASLSFDAEHVTGVELNPVTVSLLEDRFADFTGHLPENERVTLVNAEGRSFLSRDDGRYDLVYFVAPDSYAASAAAQSSGFVLVESYLYTVEMVLEAVAHLRPAGVLCMQFGEVDYATKPNRTARYLATARLAFAELGIDDFAQHVLFATNDDFPIGQSTILLSREPFTERQTAAFADATARVNTGRVRHAPGVVTSNDVPGYVITRAEAELSALFDGYPYEIRPVHDDAPFFWHFARFRDVIARDNAALRNPIGPEDGRGESALVAAFAVTTVFAAAVLLLPLLIARQRFAQVPARGRALVFFAGVGLAFMLLEIALIQKLTLFLGYPTYTLSVTLFSLLVFTGWGSVLSERYVDSRDRVLPALAAIVVGLALFFAFGVDEVVRALAGIPLAARIAVAVGLLAPLGLVLGAFMPLGLVTVSRASPRAGDTIAWGWAINGIFSVIASLLATMLSMTYGFRVVIGIAAVLYLMAAAALRAIPLRPAAK